MLLFCFNFTRYFSIVYNSKLQAFFCQHLKDLVPLSFGLHYFWWNVQLNCVCVSCVFFLLALFEIFFFPLICCQHFNYKVTGCDFFIFILLMTSSVLGLWVYICFLLFNHLKSLAASCPHRLPLLQVCSSISYTRLGVCFTWGYWFKSGWGVHFYLKFSESGLPCIYNLFTK